MFTRSHMALALLLLVSCGRKAGKDTSGAEMEESVEASPYAPWQNGPLADPAFFPLGVWVQDPRNAELYQEIGINTYVGLWQGPPEDQLRP